jgi:hypothetical protein
MSISLDSPPPPVYGWPQTGGSVPPLTREKEKHLEPIEFKHKRRDRIGRRPVRRVPRSETHSRHRLVVVVGDSADLDSGSGGGSSCETGIGKKPLLARNGLAFSLKGKRNAIWLPFPPARTSSKKGGDTLCFCSSPLRCRWTTLPPVVYPSSPTTIGATLHTITNKSHHNSRAKS